VEDNPSSYLVPNADKMIPPDAQPRRQRSSAACDLQRKAACRPNFFDRWAQERGHRDFAALSYFSAALLDQAKGCGDLRSRVDDVSQPRTVAALGEQAAESYLLPARYAVKARPSLVLEASPFTWSHADVAQKGSSEVALIGEAALGRDLGQRARRASQKALCAFQPQVHQPLVGRHTCRLAERATEMPN